MTSSCLLNPSVDYFDSVLKRPKKRFRITPLDLNQFSSEEDSGDENSDLPCAEEDSLTGCSVGVSENPECFSENSLGFSDEERKKTIRRKEQNRKAAKKSRARKKLQFQGLSKLNDNLKLRLEKYNSNLKILQDEIQKLKSEMISYRSQTSKTIKHLQMECAYKQSLTFDLVLKHGSSHSTHFSTKKNISPFDQQQLTTMWINHF